MRRILIVISVTILAAAIPALGQSGDKSSYQFKLEFDPRQDVELLDRHEGKEALYIKVKFNAVYTGATADPLGTRYKVLIEEDGVKVKEVDLPEPAPSGDLSVVLAMDVSGSMNEHGRIEQARGAADIFFSNLPAKAETGLILFNHRAQVSVRPGASRPDLLQQVRSYRPIGGTAYFDATAEAVSMLERVGANNKRIAVVMTDGVDLNSIATLREVIERAKKSRVQVYTIGIGEPGHQQPVNSVVVLDTSASMLEPADDKDKVSKLVALQDAAGRFINMLGSINRSTILEFGDLVKTPKAFTSSKEQLRGLVDGLKGAGETAVFDAVYSAIATLEAENPKGKRVVVALTDGVDNSSRRRVDEVIERAKEAKIPIYMLGFGRTGELDVDVMKRLADETGGQYYYAGNQSKLMEHFESLAIRIHDDGIDEASLQQLSQETGGRYYPAKNVADLKIIMQNVTSTIQPKIYTIVFPSLRQVRDGHTRHVSLKLVRGNELVSNAASYEVIDTKVVNTQVSGLVIAEMDYFVYLFLLAVLVALLAVPEILRRRPASA